MTETPRHESNGGEQDVPRGFIIDITEEFDPDSFDSQLRAVGDLSYLSSPASGDIYNAKYVAIGEKLIILFPASENHLEGLERMQGEHPELQGGIISSAGFIDGRFYSDDSGSARTQRIIHGLSTSLVDGRLLSKDASKTYRQTVLKENLGDFFIIVD